MGILVKNKNVFTSVSCSCDSYMDHWSNHSGSKAIVCSAKGCTEKKGLVGAHVIKCHGNSSSTQYIVPLCPSCNSAHKTDCFELNMNAILIPVTDRHKCS